MIAAHHPHDGEQTVESGEMIHVRMRDEDVREPHQLARRQRVDVADVEQQRAPLVAKVDVDPGIAECLVGELRLEQPVHRVRLRAGPA